MNGNPIGAQVACPKCGALFPLEVGWGRRTFAARLARDCQAEPPAQCVGRDRTEAAS